MIIDKEEFVKKMKYHRAAWFLRDDYDVILKKGMSVCENVIKNED